MVFYKDMGMVWEKLFSYVLSNRLPKISLDKNIFSLTQLGFPKGNLTFSIEIHKLINKTCHKYNRGDYSTGIFIMEQGYLAGKFTMDLLHYSQ